MLPTLQFTHFMAADSVVTVRISFTLKVIDL